MGLRSQGSRDADAASPRASAAVARAVGAVARFMLGSIAAIAVVVVGGFFALRGVTVREAERDTRDRVELQGGLLEASGLTDGLLRGDPDAIAKVDDVVLARLLSDSVVRVKIWSRDGRILYSDEPELIGKRFELGEEERELFTTGGADAELSDLSRPENRFERQEGKLLEAHTPIRTPNGTPVLFETYGRFESTSANGRRLLGALAPTLIAALVVLLLSQVPLAWSLARRLQRGYREREVLLERAIEASDHERRRIAADLHDGVVQDLAGVAFGLAPLADSAERRGAADDAAALRDSTSRLRHGMRALRTLLVEIHPPSLESAGLEATLHDLLSSLQAQDVATELHVDDRAAAGSPRPARLSRRARGAAQRRRPRRGLVGARRGHAGGSEHHPVDRDRRRQGIRRRAARGARPGGARRADPARGARRPAGRHARGPVPAGRGNDRRDGGAGNVIRVLLADDHGVIRDGLGRLIAGLDDIELVGMAVDGQDAVRRSAELAPDVVLMDLEMPELDGIEATRRVPLTPGGRAGPDVVLRSPADPGCDRSGRMRLPAQGRHGGRGRRRHPRRGQGRVAGRSAGGAHDPHGAVRARSRRAPVGA